MNIQQLTDQLVEKHGSKMDNCVILIDINDWPDSEMDERGLHIATVHLCYNEGTVYSSELYVEPRTNNAFKSFSLMQFNVLPILYPVDTRPKIGHMMLENAVNQLFAAIIGEGVLYL